MGWLGSWFYNWLIIGKYRIMRALSFKDLMQAIVHKKDERESWRKGGDKQRKSLWKNEDMWSTSASTLHFVTLWIGKHELWKRAHLSAVVQLIWAWQVFRLTVSKTWRSSEAADPDSKSARSQMATPALQELGHLCTPWVHKSWLFDPSWVSTVRYTVWSQNRQTAGGRIRLETGAMKGLKTSGEWDSWGYHYIWS